MLSKLRMNKGRQPLPVGRVYTTVRQQPKRQWHPPKGGGKGKPQPKKKPQPQKPKPHAPGPQFQRMDPRSKVNIPIPRSMGSALPITGMTELNFTTNEFVNILVILQNTGVSGTIVTMLQKKSASAMGTLGDGLARSPCWHSPLGVGPTMEVPLPDVP